MNDDTELDPMIAWALEQMGISQADIAEYAAHLDRLDSMEGGDADGVSKLH